MAETTDKTKKAKAPAKPRAAAGTAKKPSTRKPKATQEVAVAAAIIPTPSHEEIAMLARQYWIDRGQQDGHAEQDWLRAEQTLTQMAS